MWGSPDGRSGTGWRAVVAMLLALAVGACAIEPQPLHLGNEECAHCRMMITEPQFAAQALNNKGKAFKFDAVECLASWVLAGEVDAAEIHSLWVADHEEPTRWLRVEEAAFLRSGAVHSPMGAGLIALRDGDAARDQQRARGGEVMGWDGVLALSRDGAAHGHGTHTHAH
jgi:copper chaperone NosL